MTRKFLIATLILSIALTATGCDSFGEKGPSWDQVSSGVLQVIGNWYVDTECDSDFNTAATSIALRWARANYLKGLRNFVVKMVTAEAVQGIVGYIFPASLATGFLRDQVVAWIYKTTSEHLEGQAEFRVDNVSLNVAQIKQRQPGEFCTAISGNIPSELIFTDFILVGYNQESRKVSILLVSEHDGDRSLFNGVKQRAWAAEFEVDSNGLPITSGQSLKPIDLAEVLQLMDEIIGMALTPVQTPGVYGMVIGEETETPQAFPTDRIAFVSDRDGNKEIYLMELVGTTVVSLTNLTNNPADDYDPVWSPDGTRIAFVSNRDPNLAECWPNDEIYVMDADGSHVTRLTDNPALDWTPVWSPDGTRIAFISTRVEPAAACQCVLCNRGIYVMDADGSHVTRLTEITPYDRDPSWSPDGRRIAFVGSTSVSVHVYTTAVIYVMDVDGSHATPLSDNAALELGPAWSPDGTRIAFVSYRDSNAEIYMMDADGSHVTRLTDNPAVDLGPAWSPDGTRISFASYRDGNGEIYVMDADGSNVTRLTDNPVDDWGPVWAPISTATTELQALDRGDARSVLEWFLYAIENKDISVFENLIPEQGVIYTPVGIGEGGVHITRDQFLSDLQHRLDSSPQCYGISYLEDQSLTVWTKGWLPEWKISEFCYQGCQPFNLTSDYAGFSFDLKERELQEREWEHVVIIGEYDYWDSSIYPPLRPCNQSSLIIQSSCPSAPLQRMVVGQRGYVCTVSDSVSLREEPGRSSSKITALTTGVYFTVIGGPSCADDWSWWQIQIDDGITGWISEGGDNIDPYYICPAP